jgi:hypothetical protein
VSLARHAKRRDANEGEIVEALEACGAYVHRQDLPCDLLVGFRGRWWLLEVKDGAKPAYERILTHQQIAFRNDCLHHGLPFAVVTTVSEALAAIGAVR